MTCSWDDVRLGEAGTVKTWQEGGVKAFYQVPLLLAPCLRPRLSDGRTMRVPESLPLQPKVCHARVRSMREVRS